MQKTDVSDIMGQQYLYLVNNMIKSDLDNLIKQYKVQPVGWGYLDCIISLDNVYDFINELSSIGIKIYGVTWWCHCKDKNPNNFGTPDSAECPHGYGGPRSVYYDGWFSEMWFKMPEFDNNEQVITYLNSPNDENMLEWFENRLKCFTPALWLDVPDDWRNELSTTK